MKIRTSLAAAGAAVVLSTTGALMLPAVASAHSGTHTLKFIAVQKATVNFTTATQGVQETDTSTAGKTYRLRHDLRQGLPRRAAAR